jgi:hypothetical protein
MPQSGNVYFGSKADLLIQGDYGDSPRVVTGPGETVIGKPPVLLPRNPDGTGDYGQYAEWRRACVGEKDWKHPGSNFTYAAPFTEAILLGNIALRVGKLGEKLEYDAKQMKFTNNEEANRYLNKTYRKGWEPLKLA